ncbi:MAG: SUMF1/EgtB/PvdO family nonheme iron enzyme, partial [Proteobacteria bacterium]|nr:SUMF1/EgtB/PvdO family nonheme iron enzyme [Pseudomonadota bacterium]
IVDDVPGVADTGMAEGELSEQGTGEGTQGDGGAEAGPATEELLDEEEFDILDEAEILEQETEIVDDASGVAGTGMAEGELSEQGTGEGTKGDGGAEAGPAGEELLDEEEFDILDETEILEQEAEIADDAQGVADADAEAGPAAEELLNEEDFELLDEAEILAKETEIVDDVPGVADTGMAEGELSEQGTGEGTQGDGGVEAGPAGEELLDEEEFDILDEAEILEQETEIIAEDASTQVGEIGATDNGQSDSGRPLDLSHYIEPDEALASPPETLTENHDDYITQILERFMPKFIKIPAGNYLTGRDQPAYNGRPTRKIFLQSFYIAQLPVTNDLFDFFVRETGYETDAERAGFGNVVEGRISNRIDPDTGRTVLFINRGIRSRRTQGANWRHPSGPGSSLENKGNHPVVQVSRHDALVFAAWAGKRLPSEDEWEAAARGPDGLLFPWGNEWYRERANTESSLTGDTTPVIRHGKTSMSPFGVYDLLGNVFEWTATVHPPSRPANNRTPPVYVLKGGCWTSKTGITVADRLLEPDTWSNTIGFRCAV